MYSLSLGDIVTASEFSVKHIEEIRCAKKIRRARAVVSVSRLKEITVLTQALIQPFASPAAAALNLLKLTSLRLHHLLNHLRQ